MPAGDLTREELRRHVRHLALPEVGEEGQKRLRRSRALLVGLGGLGSPVALYLAAAGVGNLVLVDPDSVEVSNLDRQIIHGTGDVGRPKVDSARESLAALNPGVTVETHQVALDGGNAGDLVAGCDVAVGALDNLPARYVLNDACVGAGVPLVEGGVLRLEGMILTIVPGRGPCYRCLFPRPPEDVPDPAREGLLGVLPGIVGTIQALEVLKLLLGTGTTLAGRLLILDGLTTRFQEVEVSRDPACRTCGDNSRIARGEPV